MTVNIAERYFNAQTVPHRFVERCPATWTNGSLLESHYERFRSTSMWVFLSRQNSLRLVNANVFFSQPQKHLAVLLLNKSTRGKVVVVLTVDEPQLAEHQVTSATK